MYGVYSIIEVIYKASKRDIFLLLHFLAYKTKRLLNQSNLFCTRCHKQTKAR